MLSLKFTQSLISQILSGEKDSTWRLFDDKDFKEGDKVSLVNKETLEEFGIAKIISTREKKLGELTDLDFEGHERYENEEKMYKTYRSYYGDRVSPDSTLKIIKFKLEK